MIRLRPFRPEDAQRLYEIESQSEMVRYQSFPPRTRENAAKYVKEAIEADSVKGIEYVICLENGDGMIGRVGAAFEEHHGLEGPNTAWVWYMVDPLYQGHGIAKAAVRLLAQNLETHAIKIECDPANAASCRVAEGLGFVIEREGEINIEGITYLSRVYGLPAGGITSTL
jgi:RimJ/RimL family protein N-acetyltransferase